MIPEVFLNIHYIETRRENLDEFLNARGVPWLIRKVISGKLKNGQFLLKVNGDNYSYKTADPARNLEYSFKLGESFNAIGYDGKQHKITISMEGDKLKEVHLNLERNVGEDVFYYYFQNGKLFSECETTNNGKVVVWKREFTRKY